MNYYTQYLSMSDFSSALTVGMLILVVAFVVLTVLRGLSQGVARQTFRLLFAGAAAALAFVLCGRFYPALVTLCEGKSVAGVFATFSLSGVYESLSETLRTVLDSVDLATVTQVSALPVTLLLVPVLFLILFFLIYILLYLFSLVLCAALGYLKRNNTAITRTLGGIVGALQGALIAAIVLFPVVGMLNFVGTAAENTDDPDAAIVTLYEEHLEAAHRSPIASLINKCGADALYAKMTTVSLKADADPIDTRVPAEKLIAIYTEIDGIGELDFASITEQQKAHLRAVVDIVGEDAYLASVVSGILRGVASSSLVEDTLLANFDEPMYSIFEEWFALFATTDETTLKMDMNTVFDVMFIFSDHGVIDALSEGEDALHDVLVAHDENDETVIHKIIVTFEQNPRTHHLLTSMTRLGLTLMAGDMELGLTEESLAVYEDLKDDILDQVLTIREEDFDGDTEAYETAISEALGGVLADNGIDVSEEVVRSMAKNVAENHMTVEDFGDMSMNDIVLHYFEIYMESQNP